MARKIRMKASEQMNLPYDLIGGAMMVSIQDNRSLQIENFKSILEYSKELLRIQGINERIQIQGKNLEIIYYTNYECSIKGNINNILYEMIDSVE